MAPKAAFERRQIWFPEMGCSIRGRGDTVLGGKAANLARLEALGLPVPPWFAITTEAFERAVAGLRERIDTRLAKEDLGAACSEIRAWILALDLPPGLAEAVDAAHSARIGDDAFVAVRSSAAGEDAVGSPSPGF